MLIVDPEELGRLLIEAMCSLLIEHLAHHGQHQAKRAIHHLHRNVLGWTTHDQPDEMED